MSMIPSQDVFADTGDWREPAIGHHAPDAREGVPPFFQTTALEAVPVAQRAAESDNIRTASFIEPYKLVGHRRGRRSVTISCPTSKTSIGVDGPVVVTPGGFQVSDDRSYLEINMGFQVNPGDSLRIASEAEVWVAPLPGASSGYCQYVETYDAPSGPQP